MIKHGIAKNIDYSKTCFHNPKMVYSHSENERPSGKIDLTQPFRELSNKHKNGNKFLQIAKKGSNKIGKNLYKGAIELLSEIQENDNTDNIFEKHSNSKEGIILSAYKRVKEISLRIIILIQRFEAFNPRSNAA